MFFLVWGNNWDNQTIIHPTTKKISFDCDVTMMVNRSSHFKVLTSFFKLTINSVDMLVNDLSTLFARVIIQSSKEFLVSMPACATHKALGDTGYYISVNTLKVIIFRSTNSKLL